MAHLWISTQISGELIELISYGFSMEIFIKILCQSYDLVFLLTDVHIRGENVFYIKLRVGMSSMGDVAQVKPVSNILANEFFIHIIYMCDTYKYIIYINRNFYFK